MSTRESLTKLKVNEMRNEMNGSIIPKQKLPLESVGHDPFIFEQHLVRALYGIFFFGGGSGMDVCLKFKIHETAPWGVSPGR